MISLFGRRMTDLSFPAPARLPSATDGVGFLAHVSGRYRRGRAYHHNRDSFVRSQVLQLARRVSIEWEGDERHSAQDAINAILGESRSCPQGYYHQLVAKVELRIGASELQTAIQAREDRGRVERLRALKASLYTDFGLLAIDCLERQPRPLIDEIKIDDLRRFADELAEREQWWSPLMIAWKELAAQARSPEAVESAMTVLLEAIRQLDATLAARHGLLAAQATEETA